METTDENLKSVEAGVAALTAGMEWDARALEAAGVDPGRSFLRHVVLAPLLAAVREGVLRGGLLGGEEGITRTVHAGMRRFLAASRLWHGTKARAARLGVLHLHESVELGGAERSLLHLAESLPAPYLARFVLPRDGPLAERLEATGTPTHRLALPSMKRPHAFVPALLGVARLARATGARLLHAHSPRTYPYAVLAARLAGVKAILHVRVLLGDERFDPLTLFAPLAHLVIANGAEARRRVPGRTPALIIPNGVDAARFDPARADPAAARARLGLPPRGIVIGMAARLDPAKGALDFLEAAERIVAAGIDARFVIAGGAVFPGEESFELKLRLRAVSPALAGRVHFPGMTEDQPALYSALDLFAHPSRRDACPRAVIEAQAAGLPAVVTDSGGAAEIVEAGVTGEVVPVGDPAALAERLVALAGDPARRLRYGRAARQRVKALFTLERNARATAAAYDRLLGRRP